MFGFGKLNAAVVGTGYMASRMSDVLSTVGTVRPYAVVSRDLDRALQFGRENGYKKAYDSMKNMLDDKKVDFVYIATPASEHAEQVRMCIERGKPVLCETPIALTSAEAESLFSLASSLDVLVVEAVHVRFLPFFKQIVSVISSGEIGNPVMLTANIASDIENVTRLQRPSLGGGALGDLGYFLLNFSSMIFGDKIKRIQSSCVFTPMRVDRQLNITLQFKDDRMAVLSCTTSGNGESRAVIQGTKGYMVIENLMNFETITVYGSKRNKTGFYKRPKQKNEYEFELVAFIAAMKAGWKECPEIPHAQSVSIMHMMDFIRRQLGISYEEIQTSPLPGLPHSGTAADVQQLGTEGTAIPSFVSLHDEAHLVQETVEAVPAAEEKPAQTVSEDTVSADSASKDSASKDSVSIETVFTDSFSDDSSSEDAASQRTEEIPEEMKKAGSEEDAPESVVTDPAAMWDDTSK